MKETLPSVLVHACGMLRDADLGGSEIVRCWRAATVARQLTALRVVECSSCYCCVGAGVERGRTAPLVSVTQGSRCCLVSDAGRISR